MYDEYYNTYPRHVFRFNLEYVTLLHCLHLGRYEFHIIRICFSPRFFFLSLFCYNTHIVLNTDVERTCNDNNTQDNEKQLQKKTAAETSERKKKLAQVKEVI